MNREGKLKCRYHSEVIYCILVQYVQTIFKAMQTFCIILYDTLMVETCNYIIVQMNRKYNSESEPLCKRSSLSDFDDDAGSLPTAMWVQVVRGIPLYPPLNVDGNPRLL